MFRFLILAFVATAFADTHDGPCPEVKPVENFNLTAYQGVWYEISKLPIASEGKGKCGQAEYTLNGDEVKVKNSHVLDGEQKFIEGTAKFAADANNAAKLLVSFKFGEFVSESGLQILTTDYHSYSIAYNCKYDEKTKTHNEQAWILSRSKSLEGEAKTTVDAFLKEHSKVIDSTKLVKTDFSEEACKFTGSSVMTEQTAKP
ncbi:bilin-binding protein-like [Helicoverpa zea]|uniref:bilin-binding protein-like n=1 Tax=Helicoverpa zea TaxID=7113 RepID=UPI001F5753C5|nr:bilin-binding protein-like [Helicoverpa zea]